MISRGEKSGQIPAEFYGFPSNLQEAADHNFAWEFFNRNIGVPRQSKRLQFYTLHWKGNNVQVCIGEHKNFYYRK